MTTKVSDPPDISVVMPAYNAGRYVAAAVESILKQVFSSFEFIIINDGSTDDTSEVLQGFSDPRIRLVERENRGFARTLNEAIDMARGRYIARMDADDISLPERLKWQYEFMERNPGVDILGGQADIINENGDRYDTTRMPTSWMNISRFIEYACPLCHPAYFVRRPVYETLKGYRHMPPVEDYDFLFRALEHGYVMQNLSQKVLCHRKASAGMSAENIQRTLYATRQVQRMHALRVRKERCEKTILKRLETYRRKPGFWFKTIYGLRERLLRLKKRHQKFPARMILVMVALVSLLHYQVALNSYHTLRSFQWKD